MSLSELRNLTDRLSKHAVLPNLIPNLALRRTERTTGYEALMYEPMIYFVLQGEKQLSIGRESLTYGAAHFLILSVDVPVNARVLQASSEKPFLGIEIRLSRDLAREGALEMLPALPLEAGPAFAVGSMSGPIADVLTRLTALMEMPADAAHLAPLYTRELLYRVGQSPQGHHLRDALRVGGQSAQIQRAIDWIKANSREKVSIDLLAKIAGMGVTTFHRRFKSVTNLSPGAYHKMVRLHEARRLLLEARTVSSVAFAVGYESASQFSREYTAQFGAPPRKDMP
ncbi:AraC family transcriptional regulator [Shinella sp. WSJ-2]|uniref:AraC family transcriptional regulator n=1 Tax=Shinella sp. WSJ-2 TaxID=2303749 RepID=UPI000E3D9FF9|nr:AraC family transcriptional regulator [Shinella sp. WSJ-2]RFZ86147.1 AraC family transcriptional regulator [Shinella sp. WSJ-2]